jgi:hypothetical protein
MTWKALVLGAVGGGLLGFACSSPDVTDTSVGTPGPGNTPPGMSGPPVVPPPFVLPPAPTGAPTAPGAGPCVNLQCQQTTCISGNCSQPRCPAGQKTTLRGKVFDPAGRVPLYNVLVYVPNTPLDPISVGPSCDRCDTPISGRPIASALTDTKGEFVLDNVPVGENIPVVVQVGKWRREVKVARTEACTETVVDDPNLLRLPRNQTEGNIPRIALTTGGADRLECLLRKIGIEDSEFTPEAGPGRVNFFVARGVGGTPATSAFAPTLNAGAPFTPAKTFWDDPEAFKRYDMVILSCEGQQFPEDKSAAARAALVAYSDMGGRVFASHWHNIWLQGGPPPWSSVATFTNNQQTLPNNYLGDVQTTFPKGNALADWLVNVGASTVRGQLPIQEGKRTVGTVNPTYSTAWIQSPATQQPGVQYFTFNTPAGAMAGMECGRVVFTDIHVSAGDTSGPAFPGGCVTTELSPQEKALEFILFDLSSCVQPDDKPPVIP